MADTIDVNKLKKDAFKAIDALFGEEEEGSGATKSEPIVSTIDDFAVLDEFILSLDWEYSESEIQRLVEHLNTIGANNLNPYNQSLIKMLNSIIAYLTKAKNKAFPETFNVLSGLIGVLKKINSAGFDDSLARSEVGKAYQTVKDLKTRISDYNFKLKQNLAKTDDTGSETPPVSSSNQKPEWFASVRRDSKPEPVEINPNDFLEDDGNEDIFTDRQDASKPSFFAGPTNFDQIEARIIERLDRYEQRLAFLEDQNRKLKEIVDQQVNAGISTGNELETTIKSNGLEDDFMFGEFSSPFETAPSSDETETVSLDDILMDGADDAEPGNLMDTEAKTEVSTDIQTQSETDTDWLVDDSPLTEEIRSSENNGSQTGNFDEKIRVFKLDQIEISIPESNVSNVYKLPSKLKSRIHSLQSMRLGELATLFQRLSKNMKGSLQEMKEKQLKDITAQVRLPGTEKIEFKYAVLCSYRDDHVIIPVSDRIKSGEQTSGRRKALENRFSQFSVQTEDERTLPLIVFG